MGTGVKVSGDDLYNTPPDQAEIEFENEGGDTYICGNPPYKGSQWQTNEHKADLENVFAGRVKRWKSLDYVAGWFAKAADYGTRTRAATAIVSTNSICQGQQVPSLWPFIFKTGHGISFAHTSFQWANLANHNAGVTVVIVGISRNAGKSRLLFTTSKDGSVTAKEVSNINAYLVSAPNVEVEAQSIPLSDRAEMQFGNHPYYGTALILSSVEGREIVQASPAASEFIRPLFGSAEFISGIPRVCLWIDESTVDRAMRIPAIAKRLLEVSAARRAVNKDKGAQRLADAPYRFREQYVAKKHSLIVPRVRACAKII